MNRHTPRLLLTLGAVLLLLTGCASPETSAYRAVGATAYAVDAAMNGWGDYVRAGKASPAQQNNVRRAYERYQVAMRTAHAALRAYKTSPQPDRAALARALDALDAARAALLTTAQPATP